MATKISYKHKSDRIGLGLAVSALSLKRGERRSLRELAAYCGCSWQNLYLIEHRALRKIRRHSFLKDPAMRELLAYYVK